MRQQTKEIRQFKVLIMAIALRGKAIQRWKFRIPNEYLIVWRTKLRKKCKNIRFVQVLYMKFRFSTE